MKLRILLFTAVVVLAGAILCLSECNNSEGNAYVPRSDFQKASKAEGAYEYWKSIKANVHTGEIEADDAINMSAAVKKYERLASTKNDDVFWEFMGPNNVGGRTRAILVFEDDVNTLIAGSIGGGLFKSTDRAQSWQRLSGFEDNLIVGSIARLGNGAIYVGTGHSREGELPADGGSPAFVGGGLYVSNDDGTTWSQVSDFAPEPWSPDEDWTSTNHLAADPSNPDRLWIGSNFGLYPYIHGSEELEPLPAGLQPSAVSDFDVSQDGSTILVAVGPRVFVSTDFGASFEQRNTGAFTTSGNATIDVAIAPDNANEMYASVSTSTGILKGIYGTINAGVVWTAASAGSTPGAFAPFVNLELQRGQGNYNNMITVVPNSFTGNREVIMGGVSVYKYGIPFGSSPGISLWEEITAPFSSSPGAPPSPVYVHSDIHTATWDSEGLLYLGTDGGIFVSPNNGAVWLNVNFEYSTTQYYALAFNPDGQIVGGLQDNGSIFITQEGVSSEQGVQISGGDGFDCEISQEDPNFMFTSQYNGVVFRSTDRGENTTIMFGLLEESNGGGDDFNLDLAFHENMNNEFAQQFVEFTPQSDNPFIQFFPEGTFEVTAEGDTIIGRIPTGTQIITEADNSNFEVATITEEDVNFYSYYQREIGGDIFILHNVADTLLIQEKEQFLLAAALSNGVYVTREPIKTNGTPVWYQVGEDEGTVRPTSIEWSPDGDHLYVGYENGRLFRYSGFQNAWTEEELVFDEDDYALTKTTIHNANAAITDIEVDYSDGRGTTEGQPLASERVAISIGGYGGSGKVQVSDDAASTSGSGSFEDIWNVPSDIEGMPCYSIVMDLTDPNIFMVGTEHGIWYSGDNGQTWSVANNGDMSRTPVLDLRQQKQPDFKVENSGVVFAGTHGQGVFRSSYLLNENTSADFGFEVAELGPVSVFPNPALDMATIQFDLAVNDDVDIYIYSIDGRLIKADQNNRIESGQKQQIRLNVSDLATGTYIVQVQVGNNVETAKFIKGN